MHAHRGKEGELARLDTDATTGGCATGLLGLYGLTLSIIDGDLYLLRCQTYSIHWVEAHPRSTNGLRRHFISLGHTLGGGHELEGTQLC